MKELCYHLQLRTQRLSLALDDTAHSQLMLSHGTIDFSKEIIAGAPSVGLAFD